MKLRTRAMPFLILSALAGGALGAADLSWGVGASLAFPTSDLKTVVDSSIGLSLNGFALVDLDHGIALRPQLVATALSGKPGSVPTNQGSATVNGLKVTVSTVSLDVDGLYYFNQTTRQGFYAGPGIGIASTEVKVENVLPGGGDVSKSKTAAIGSLAAGYQFNEHWSAEISYRYTKWSYGLGQGVSLNWTLPTFLAGATYRF